MPGTFGSLWGFPLGWLLGQGIPEWGRLGIGLVMFLVGIPLCDRAARLRGSKDPGSVVWDEIAAFPFVYAFVPINWQTLIAGFVLFRIFDISKPPPVRTVERLGGGVGIMIDDTVAAFYAVFVLLVLI
ncbi:MAG: phosphatidylglycerophosphatase A [Fuerstiella sp.]|nr:phosphatidylglycerophosphatase A [Fuerstiella sp.]